MADLKLEIRGLKELNTYLTNLPSKMNSSFNQAQNQFIDFVQKSAKLRAPRLTGALAQSITKYKPKKSAVGLIVNSPYAYFQEYGFAAHPIFPGMDNRMGIPLFQLGFKKPVMTHGDAQPFISPAIEMGILRLNSFLNRAADKSLKE